jgi:hypothetical protein
MCQLCANVAEGVEDRLGRHIVAPMVISELESGGESVASLAPRLGRGASTKFNETTKCKFEYGTSTAYGASGPCKTLPGSGEKPVQVSTTATGLTPNTTYHFRVVTKSSKGTLQGPDIFFTTLRVTAPSVETKGTSGVGASSATLFASVNPRGG